MKNAAIVGCGNIAGFLDIPTQDKVLTHAHAYQRSSDTKLIAVCDPSLEQRKKFVQKWGESLHSYTSIKEMLKDNNIDILSICSPTEYHFQAMIEALNDPNIKIIICEKPFVLTQNELNILTPLMNSAKKKVIINFMRRYDPNMQKLSHFIEKKELGELLTFNAKFTKGLYHNGSHMLDLIEMLCGNINSLNSSSFYEYDSDFYGNFFISTEKTTGVVQNFSGDNYALFELDILLSNGRIVIKDAGHTIHIEKVTPSEQYQGYFSLKQTESFDDTMAMNLLNTLEFSLYSQDADKILDQHLNLSQKLLDIKSKGPADLHWKNP